MPDYKCGKGKAPATERSARALHAAGILSSIMASNVRIVDDDKVLVELAVNRWRVPGTTDAALLLGTLRMIREMSDEAIEEYARRRYNYVLQAE